ncbi:metallophosphoesterase [Aeromonas sp. 601027]|uniref:metallophosphoesterase n=1 Tax=unclassified Aeromonas TaxID=257493 RepID=UPI003BA31FB5
MKNILHLSDIHISNIVTKMNESRASSIMTCLIDDLISKNREIDTVFITGDLTNTAGEHEFELIKTKIIYPLIDKLKITKSDIFVTPGNHDIQRLNWKRADKFAKNDVFTNDHANKVNELFDEKNNDNDFNWFINYNNFIDWLDDTKKIIHKTNLFRIYEHNNIAIACLNSAWLANGDDKGKLAVTNSQIKLSLSTVKKYEQKIVLMHHPLDWLYDDDRAITSEFLHTSNIQMFLFGHMHELNVIQETHFNNNSLIKIQAGKFDISNNDEYSGYSVISLHQRNNLNSGDIFFRRYDHSKQFFTEWNKRVTNGRMSFSLSEKCIFNIDAFSEASSWLIDKFEYDLLCNTGLEHDKRKRLSDIYIEPKLKLEPGIAMESGTNDDSNITTNQLVNSPLSYCIFGGENTGKTTLAKKIVTELLSKQKYKNIDNIVYYLNCEEINDSKINEVKLKNKLFAFYEQSSSKVNHLKEFNKKIQDDVFSDSSIIILDSLDRCDGSVVQSILNIVRDNSHVRFILFAKNNIKKIIEGIFNETDLKSKFHIVNFSGIGRTDIRQLIEKWIPETTNKSVITRQAFNAVNKAGMPNNHFIYSMIMSIYERKSHYRKSYLHEADLLENFIEILLQKHCMTEGNRPQYKDLLLFLGFTAKHLAFERCTCIKQTELYKLVIQFNSLIGQDFDVEGYISPIIQSGIIVKIDNNYCFSQVCFFNYCFAYYLSKLDSEFYATDDGIDYLYFDKALEYLSAIKKNDIKLIKFIGERTHSYIQKTALQVQINLDEIDALSLLRSLVDKNPVELVTEENIDDGYSHRHKTEEECEVMLDEIAPVNENGATLTTYDDNITPNILLQRSLSLYARAFRAAEHIMDANETEKIMEDIFLCYKHDLTIGLYLFKTKFKEFLERAISDVMKNSKDANVPKEKIDTFIRFAASFFPIWVIDLMSNDFINQRQIVRVKELRSKVDTNFDKVIITFAMCELDDIKICDEIKSLEYKENHEVAMLLIKYIEIINFNFSIKEQEKETLTDYVKKIVGKRKSIAAEYTSIADFSNELLLEQQN